MERDAAPGQNGNSFKKRADQISDWLPDIIYVPHRMEGLSADPGKIKGFTSSQKRTDRLWGPTSLLLSR